jgi:hypothetical protein
MAGHAKCRQIGRFLRGQMAGFGLFHLAGLAGRVGRLSGRFLAAYESVKLAPESKGDGGMRLKRVEAYET